MVGIFPRSQQYFFRVRQPYISELNNEASEQDHLRQILGIKSSNGLIRVQEKIVLQSSLKQNYGFPSQVRGVNFTGVIIFLYFRLNRPLWTPQCRLLLVDNLTQPIPG